MLSLFKKIFYRYIPSAHISAYIRLLYFRKYLKKAHFDEALDAGCGSGLFTFFAAKHFPKARITGYDISEEHIDDCNKKRISDKITNVFFLQSDMRIPHQKEQYDFIFSIDVLEHIQDNFEVLENVYHGLKSNGVFYLAMPYEPGHNYLFPKEWFGDYIAWAEKEHIAEQYALETVTEILRKLRFKIEDICYTFGFWGKLAWELDMLTEKRLFLKHLLQPLLFIWGYLDTLWKNGSGSYAIRIIARK